MLQELTTDTFTCDEQEFLEKNKLKTHWFFEPGEYYTYCPYCNYPFLYVYQRPTKVDSADAKFDRLYCYCNECQITGPLHSIRKDVTYAPSEGIKHFIFESQCYYNDNVAEIAVKSIDKRKNYPSIELLAKVGVKTLDDDVLKEFRGFLGYCTRGDITNFNKSCSLRIAQKLPYKIPKDTWGLILPFGPKPGFHVGFVVIYEGYADIEMYIVRDTIYTANGRDNHIFFNCILNNERTTEDTIKKAGEFYLDRKDEDGKDWGISVLVTSYLDPINPMKQERKVVRNRFGRKDSTSEKPSKAKAKITKKKMPKRSPH